MVYTSAHGGQQTAGIGFRQTRPWTLVVAARGIGANSHLSRGGDLRSPLPDVDLYRVAAGRPYTECDAGETEAAQDPTLLVGATCGRPLRTSTWTGRPQVAPTRNVMRGGRDCSEFHLVWGRWICTRAWAKMHA